MGGRFWFLDAENDEAWASEVGGSSPICGWIIANHLDNALMIYDAACSNLGCLTVSQTDGTGQKDRTPHEVVRWDPCPRIGLTTPFPLIANRHLSGFVNARLCGGGESVSAFRELMELLDCDLTGPSQDPAFRVLVGRPIALTRAAVDVDPDCSGSAGVKVRMGDGSDVESGVLGFFLTGDGDDGEKNYEKIYPAFGLKNAPEPAGGAHLINTEPAFALSSEGGGARLTILVDPRGKISLTAGRLPVMSLSLPAEPVAEALGKLEVSFFASPILSNPSALPVPVEGGERGPWIWADQDEERRFSSEEDSLKAGGN